MNNKHSTDHMANERTFLAWVRTSIGIMAFGFVVQKFALFVKQINLLTNNSLGEPAPAAPAYSNVIGFILVLLGVFITVIAYVKFRITSNEIEKETYRPFFLYDIVLTVAILAIGVLLAFYLSPF